LSTSKTSFDIEKGEVLLIDKPYTWTSFDAVNKIRHTLKKASGIKKIKVGHAGTLDPLASGLLIICIGKETKNINQYQAQQKTYEAEIYLGKTTPSYDLETEPDQEFTTEHITKELVENVLQTFVGKSLQQPPIFSAKRIDGKRAYDIARQGKTPDLAPGEIDILHIELLEYAMPIIRVKVVCSKGTYIRSLAFDIGKALNSGAYLAGLVRTAIGDFKLENALSIQEISDSIQENVKPKQA
jgi:tRNA pseudouridine55 synthase